MRDIHVSLISHGQFDLLAPLLHDLAHMDSVDRLSVSLVVNIPESLPDGLSNQPFPLQIIQNRSPQGFGANHNLAFRSHPDPTHRVYFAVLNPDLRMRDDVLAPLISQLAAIPTAGVAAPAVLSPTGTIEDNAREFPTPARLLGKILGRRDGLVGDLRQGPFNPDWVAGMFMLFDADAFAQVGGFDERYFLYYEDVDICARLWLAGHSVILDPRLRVIHAAQRTSRRNMRYARWHLAGMARFLSSRVCREARRLRRQTD